ncbi:MAG: hypothetical protein GC206_12195 [Alphaproteobacteria bacterium]|nr:hypothetical protein [Alphaproteobacteria bacterium]
MAAASQDRALLIACCLGLMGAICFWPERQIDRFQQYDEGHGFVSAKHAYAGRRQGVRLWWSRDADDGWSVWSDVDDDRRPDVHEWTDSAGRWRQDTRQARGGQPRWLGPATPFPHEYFGSEPH